MTRFGASAPIKALYPYFGFTVDNIAAQGATVMEFYSPASGRGPAPSLIDRPQLTLTGYDH